jgi:hypothetical protein
VTAKELPVLCACGWFASHEELSPTLAQMSRRLYRASALKKTDQHHHHGDDEKKVDESAYGE